MPELLNEAQTAQAFSGNATPLIIAAIGYMIIFIPLTTLASRIERRMALGAQGMSTLIDQVFSIDIMMEALPFLLKGFLITVLPTSVLKPLGIATGLGLALAPGARNGFVRAAVRTWVHTIRALPPLVLIIVIYSALPFLGIRLPAFPCVIVALALNNSAYYCEILRAEIGAVPKGQMEAARSMGLTEAGALRHVVLPQAFRIVLPDRASNMIEVVKGTSLASIIAVAELLYMAGVARSVTFNTSPITLAALLYLVILLPAVRLSGRLARPVA